MYCAWRETLRKRDETRRDDAPSVGQPDKRLSMDAQGRKDTTVYLWNKGSAFPLIFITKSKTEPLTTVFHHCLSIKITSPSSEGGLLTGCPSWSCCCHLSINSVASRRYFISLLSLSGSPQVTECVAWAAARAACSNDPRPSLTRASALACSLEMRLVLSLWENTLSCASEAFLFRSYVPSFGADRFMGCTSSADFSKALLVFKSCRILCSPTIGELPGGGRHVFA